VNWIFQRLFGVNRNSPWSVNYSSLVNNPQNIHIAKGVKRSLAISIGCYFQGHNGIFIGENTYFGPGVRILSANHEISDIKREAQPIRIGSNCWLGANSIILPEVILGDNTIVGAGAVVTKSFPKGNLVLGGIPAKMIRSLARNESKKELT